MELRRQHPNWGPKKLQRFLPSRGRPAVATLGRWLRAAALVTSRRPRQQSEPVRRVFGRLFRRFGPPRVIRCDHGVPWASTEPLGLAALAVWWWRLGIRGEFTAKGHPEQNAAHEQHHRILKADTARPPAPPAGAQQQRFHRWRHYYKQRRPHEALGQRPPASCYHPRPQAKAVTAQWPRYGRTATGRRVHPNGEIVWEGRRRFIGAALAGQPVGLYRLEEGVWSVRFLHLELGHLHRADSGAVHPARFGTAKQSNNVSGRSRV